MFFLNSTYMYVCRDTGPQNQMSSFAEVWSHQCLQREHMRSVEEYRERYQKAGEKDLGDVWRVQTRRGAEVNDRC